MRFVQAAAAVAGIANVRTAAGRSEELGQDASMRERFDVVTARAVAETRVLAEFCLPFAAVGGLWVAAKGPDVGEEVQAGLQAIRLLGGEYLGTVPVESFSADGQRCAVLVRKAAATPQRYPRAPGTPKKRPL